MDNRGLLFIPDISGFTRFVNETEIQHSRVIIEELLEVLINANEMELAVSEIEGDAILFYKFGSKPDMEELFKQVEKMFCTFHSQLQSYEYRRFCQCDACTSAIDLTLKVVTHYGEFTGYNVRQFNKLIGKDVIVAHQLLKNDIPQHEYWLVTAGLLPEDKPASLAGWMKWDSSVKQTETGSIPFHYTLLSQLKDELPAEQLAQLDLSNKKKLFSLSDEYETDIIRLLHATGDFKYRHRWKEGVKEVKDVSEFLPRLGMRYRNILENGESVTYASSYSFTDDHIEFSETEEKKKDVAYYTLDKIGPSKTRLTIDYYSGDSFVSRLLASFKKRQLEEEFKKSMKNLHSLIKEILLPDEQGKN